MERIHKNCIYFEASETKRGTCCIDRIDHLSVFEDGVACRDYCSKDED